MPKPPSGPVCACGHTMAARDLVTFRCRKCGATAKRWRTPEELEAARARHREHANRSHAKAKPRKLTPKQIAPDVSGTQSAPVIVPGRGIECYGDVIEIVYRDYRPWLILNGGNPLPASPIEAALYRKLQEATA